MKQVVTFARLEDSYSFRIGQPIRLLNNGRPTPRWHALLRAWRWLTSLFRPYHVVTAVNIECGTITIRTVRRWYHFL